MSIDRVRAKIESLRSSYPNDFRVMLSAEDITKNKFEVMNAEMHGPFAFEDTQFTEIIERALNAGKQVSLQSGGQDRVLIFTAKSGKNLFDVQQSSKDEMVNTIMNSLEEMHDRYIGSDGNHLLYGGFDSFIYQDKFADIAQKYGFPKYKSYDIADKSVLNDVRHCLESQQTVIAIAWTKENRIDIYVEPQDSSQSNTYYPSDSTNLSYPSDSTNSALPTNNGISVLAAIGTFILSFFFMVAVGSSFGGYCCFPIILTVVAYFVTPTVIKSISKK